MPVELLDFFWDSGSEDLNDLEITMRESDDAKAGTYRWQLENPGMVPEKPKVSNTSTAKTFDGSDRTESKDSSLSVVNNDEITFAIDELLDVPFTSTSEAFRGPDGKPLSTEVAVNAYQRGEFSTGKLELECLPSSLFASERSFSVEAAYFAQPRPDTKITALSDDRNLIVSDEYVFAPRSNNGTARERYELEVPLLGLKNMNREVSFAPYDWSNPLLAQATRSPCSDENPLHGFNFDADDTSMISDYRSSSRVDYEQLLRSDATMVKERYGMEMPLCGSKDTVRGVELTPGNDTQSFMASIRQMTPQPSTHTLTRDKSLPAVPASPSTVSDYYSEIGDHLYELPAYPTVSTSMLPRQNHRYLPYEEYMVVDEPEKSPDILHPAHQSDRKAPPAFKFPNLPECSPPLTGSTFSHGRSNEHANTYHQSLARAPTQTNGIKSHLVRNESQAQRRASPEQIMVYAKAMEDVHGLRRLHQDKIMRTGSCSSSDSERALKDARTSIERDIRREIRHGGVRTYPMKRKTSALRSMDSSAASMEISHQKQHPKSSSGNTAMNSASSGQPYSEVEKIAGRQDIIERISQQLDEQQSGVGGNRKSAEELEQQQMAMIDKLLRGTGSGVNLRRHKDSTIRKVFKDTKKGLLGLGKSSNSF
ncbi:hypothetical protein MMC09_006694 [Bachmanniomyces sp. S44760]|nr:hypothetical protein [Bachmanniomyces sp. S44760]